MRFALTKNNITDYGLSFFFEVLKDLVISREFIKTIYRVIIHNARMKLHPLKNTEEVAPELLEIMSEQEKQAR